MGTADGIQDMVEDPAQAPVLSRSHRLEIDLEGGQ